MSLLPCVSGWSSFESCCVFRPRDCCKQSRVPHQQLMHWLHRAVPTQPFVKSFGKLSSVLCYQKATQISLHHIFWLLTLWGLVAGAGVQRRSVPQSLALERKSCRHCKGNLVMAQSCPTASRQPGAKSLRCANSNPNVFFFLFFSSPTLLQSRRMASG